MVAQVVAHESPQGQRLGIRQVRDSLGVLEAERCMALCVDLAHRHQAVARHPSLQVLMRTESHCNQGVVIGQHEVRFTALETLKGFRHVTGAYHHPDARTLPLDLRKPIGSHRPGQRAPRGQGHRCGKSFPTRPSDLAPRLSHRGNQLQRKPQQSFALACQSDGTPVPLDEGRSCPGFKRPDPRPNAGCVTWRCSAARVRLPVCDSAIRSSSHLVCMAPTVAALLRRKSCVPRHPLRPACVT
jgi:hypothetical protein